MSRVEGCSIIQNALMMRIVKLSLFHVYCYFHLQVLESPQKRLGYSFLSSVGLLILLQLQ